MKNLSYLGILIASLAVLSACYEKENGNAIIQDAPHYESHAAQHEPPEVPPDDEPLPYEAEVYEPAISPLTAAMFPFEFEAEDLFGNVVTHESLGERELFLLYFWTTWCGTCVRAMPGMAELASEFYYRLGFVSLLGDFDSGRDAAISLTENVSAPFFTVDFSLEYFDPLFPFVNSGFVPTSALIDAQGNKIGNMIVGANTDELRDRINAALGN